MGTGHVGSLHVPGSSLLHRLRPECKLLAGFLFVLGVVATPREQLWAFGAHLIAIGAVAGVAGLGPRLVLRRMGIEIPFVAFAAFLPFLATGPQTRVWFMTLSVEGLWAAWNILAKATLGVMTSVVLSATTTVPEVIRGLERLRVPRAFTAILTFMARYAGVIAAEMRRMRIARASRGHDPRWIWQARAVAHSAGALFIRSYERGERVHLAMLSRGYDGSLPVLDHTVAARRDWLLAVVLPVTAVTVAACAWVVQL